MAESSHAPWKLTAIGSGIIFPHAQLAAQIVRRRRPHTSAATDTWHTETVYADIDLGSATSAPTSWPKSSASTGQSRTSCTGSKT